jgi:lysophospholipase L1-like esterase
MTERSAIDIERKGELGHTARAWLVLIAQGTMNNKAHLILTVIAGVLSVLAPVIAASTYLQSIKAQRADEPSPRTDKNSTLAHEELLEKARKGRIDVYFEGDSITRRWGASDEQYKQFLSNWRRNFFGWNAANFGWGGDTTQNILWRLHNGELDNVNPKIIVVLAGTNNVGNKSPESSQDPRVENITRGIKAIVDTCLRKAPQATIVLMGITPRNDNMAVMPIIDEINVRIAKFADGKKIRFLNINDKLADKHGKLFEGMTNKDGLHLDVKGYQVWADALKPIFTELLGPPAREDLAPPPTGDPAIKLP